MSPIGKPTGRRGRSGTSQSGSATIEFVLVLPLVLTMAMAMLQIGLFANDRLVLEDAARAGARQASVSSDNASVNQAVVEAATGLHDQQLEVRIERADGAGSAVTVTVVYHDSAAIPLVRWLMPSIIDLTARATMRQESG